MNPIDKGDMECPACGEIEFRLFNAYEAECGNCKHYAQMYVPVKPRFQAHWFAPYARGFKCA